MARPRQIALSSWILFVSAVTLSLMSGRATAQRLCSCSPSKFTFTLDFSLECPPVNVTMNAGVAATFCQISPFGGEKENIIDLVPVEILFIDVLELGQGFEVLSQKNVTAGTSTFKNGESFTFTPIITNGEDNNVTKVTQLNMYALNVLGEPIVNFYAISYSNACNAFPVLIEGGSAGWTQFTKLEPPTAKQCPGVSSGGKTAPPTDAPVAPSVPPTDAPVALPVPPTDAPVAPSVPPTDAPVAPSVPPTDAPVAPSVPPTDAPAVLVMSMSMSMSMDLAAESRAFFRLADIADASDIMYEKSEKSAKSEKKAKYEKSEKSDKSEKSHKKDKSDKESKKEKTEKKRRLRVRPIYEAV